MGIYDREWYRGSPRKAFDSVGMVMILIGVNAGVFVLQMASASFGWPRLVTYLGLRPVDVTQGGMVWELLTSMFLHGGIWHILFNMYVLWLFGPPVESRLGSWAFLRFYLAAGLVAGVAYLLVGSLRHPGVAMIGASGAIMGVLVYFTMMNPGATVLLFFVVPMKMVWVTVIFVAVDLFWTVSPGMGVIAHSAHLGGALFGFLYYLYARRVGNVVGRIEGKVSKLKEERRAEKEADVDREVDRLLEKIQEGGLDSLSPKERDFLREASKRLRKGR